MRMLALCLALAPLPGWADSLECRLVPEGGGAAVSVAFDIDRRQFAPAASPDDPPRQMRSVVAQDAQRYIAEPFLMEDGVRGFWAEERVGGAALLVIQKDGAARMTDEAIGAMLVGRCEDAG